MGRKKDADAGLTVRPLVVSSLPGVSTPPRFGVACQWPPDALPRQPEQGSEPQTPDKSRTVKYFRECFGLRVSDKTIDSIGCY
jgi:hypothetical protein